MSVPSVSLRVSTTMTMTGITATIVIGSREIMSQNEPLFYTKKPVSVQALHYTTAEDARDIVMWLTNNGCDARLSKMITADDKVADRIAIPTLEGTMYAEPGWWVIKGIKGEFYPCRDDIFRESYDVSEPAS